MKVQNYTQVQYKPSFAMKIEDPERLTAVLYNKLMDFTARYGEKYPENAVIRQIGDNWVIHTDSENICLGKRQEDIKKSIRAIVKKLSVEMPEPPGDARSSEFNMYV